MKKNTAAKLSLASLAVILGGGSVLMNTQPFTPVHAEVQDTKEAQDTTVMIDQGTAGNIWMTTLIRQPEAR